MAASPPGRPGNLTAEQELRLKELWIALFEIFGFVDSKDPSTAVSRASSISSSPNPGSESPNSNKRKSRLSWLKGKNSPDPGSEPEPADDKHGLSKDYKRALASQSKEELHVSFWDMLKADDPDALLLRFLRARKWNVHDALVMMISAFQWRNVDMRVDQDIMSKGEEYFLSQSKTGTGANKKDAEGLVAQLHMGKSLLHGLDKENRPVVIVRARLHHPGNESDKSLEMYTVYVIETARLMLRPPVDTATIVFDMTSFSLSNMDYAPVKFMIKCFEANYPESLGSVLVYKAPWLFSGIWKIIKGWLDPVVASKVHFCSNDKDIEEYISRSRLLSELDGDEQWSYSYVPPVPGENAKMSDTQAKTQILADRRKISDEYEAQTLAWARDGDRDAPARRAQLSAQFRENYWRLDPYVRARSLWDRTGVLGSGGALDFYPPATTGKTANEHNDDGVTPMAEKMDGLAVDEHADGASVYEDARSHVSDLD